MKVLFYGTPEFALPTLEGVLDRHQVVAVVTQPDRPAGPGPRVSEWPVRLLVFVSEVAVVVAFGQILPRAVLDVPPRGSINVHASLLPRYRGAAPIAWALIGGETQTGITTDRKSTR